MDIRRELDHINKEFHWLYKNQGETVIWYEFIGLDEGSTFDDVYDEGIRNAGGRAYKQGLLLPVLRVVEREDQKRAIADARLPFQNISLFISAKMMNDAGISNAWEYETHLNDMFKWDGRYYSIVDYSVRGRLKAEVYMMVEAIQVYIDQEMINDPGPTDDFYLEMPWPTKLPTLG